MRFTLPGSRSKNPTGHPVGFFWSTRLVVAFVVWLLGAFLFAVPAPAAPTFQSSSAPITVSATINVQQAIVAVSVSPSAVTFSTCTLAGNPSAGLLAPNGTCTATPNIVVTNLSNVPVRISAQATNAASSNTISGTPWALCQTLGSPQVVPCSQTSPNLGSPGLNQFAMKLTSAGNPTGFALANTYSCDATIEPVAAGICTGAGVLPTANATSSEQLSIVGPQASTEAAPVRTTSIVWLASVL